MIRNLLVASSIPVVSSRGTISASRITPQHPASALPVTRRGGFQEGQAKELAGLSQGKCIISGSRNPSLVSTPRLHIVVFQVDGEIVKSVRVEDKRCASAQETHRPISSRHQRGAVRRADEGSLAGAQ